MANSPNNFITVGMKRNFAFSALHHLGEIFSLILNFSFSSLVKKLSYQVKLIDYRTGWLKVMMSDKYRLLKDIDTLGQERVGILRLREQNSNLYGYYLDWLVRKEQKLIRKYRKKYGRLPLPSV